MLSHTQKECSFVNISSCTVAKDYEQGGVCLLNNNWPLLRRLMLIGWNLPLAEMLQHHLHYHTHWTSAEKVLGMPHLITTSKFHAYFKAQCNTDLPKKHSVWKLLKNSHFGKWSELHYFPEKTLANAFLPLENSSKFLPILFIL